MSLATTVWHVGRWRITERPLFRNIFWSLLDLYIGHIGCKRIINKQYLLFQMKRNKQTRSKLSRHRANKSQVPVMSRYPRRWKLIPPSHFLVDTALARLFTSPHTQERQSYRPISVINFSDLSQGLGMVGNDESRSPILPPKA